MGLFNKKKQKEINVAAEAATDETKDVPVEDTETQNAGEHRFTLVVESATSMLDGSGVVVTGNVHGTASVGDSVYIISLNNQIITSKIVSIETVVSEKMTLADQATDAPAQLQLDITDAKLAARFSVVSNVRPQTQININEAVENPACAGLIRELPQFQKDNVFFGMLIYALAHAHFITPLKMQGEPIKTENGTETFSKDTQIGFYMLKSQIPVAEGEGDMILPVFTDWNELHNWKSLSENGEKVRTMILTFKNIVSIVSAPNFAGFVVNPFSKGTMTINKKLIETIVSMPGYQKEFGEQAQENADVTETKVPKQTQILLGIPAESDEVTNIRKELLTYGQTHDEITSISLLMKVEQDKTQRYLIILGVEEAVAKNHMEGIYQAIKSYAVNCSNIEFAIKGRVKGIDDIAAQNEEKSLIYSA